MLSVYNICKCCYEKDNLGRSLVIISGAAPAVDPTIMSHVTISSTILN